jgi:hypothetical protein
MFNMTLKMTAVKLSLSYEATWFLLLNRFPSVQARAPSVLQFLPKSLKLSLSNENDVISGTAYPTALEVLFVGLRS